MEGQIQMEIQMEGQIQCQINNFFIYIAKCYSISDFTWFHGILGNYYS